MSAHSAKVALGAKSRWESIMFDLARSRRWHLDLAEANSGSDKRDSRSATSPT